MSSLQWVAVVGVVGMWVWYLGRPLVNKYLASRRDPIGQFSLQMLALGRPSINKSRTGRMSQTGVHRKRRQTLMGLAFSFLLSLILALGVGGMFVVTSWALGLLLVAFVGLAVYSGHQEERRRLERQFVDRGARNRNRDFESTTSGPGVLNDVDLHDSEFFDNAKVAARR